MEYQEVITITHRLFLVEGINGAGKSAAAEYITECLTKRGERAKWYEESDYEHPADYTFHAYIPNYQLNKLTTEERAQLYDAGTEVLSGLVIPLTSVSVSMFEKVMPYKIYEKLDWETEKPVLLDRWNSFAKKARSFGQAFIFEGSFLQTTIYETMIRFDLDQSAIESYINSVYQTISKLKPVVVYLHCTDISCCIEEIGKERGSLWLENMVCAYTGHAYAKSNCLSGTDGCITCLERRQSMEMEILDKLSCKKLILTDPFHDWDNTKQKIDQFVEELQ